MIFQMNWGLGATYASGADLPHHSAWDYKPLLIWGTPDHLTANEAALCGSDMERYMKLEMAAEMAVYHGGDYRAGGVASND